MKYVVTFVVGFVLGTIGGAMAVIWDEMNQPVR